MLGVGEKHLFKTPVTIKSCKFLDCSVGRSDQSLNNDEASRTMPSKKSIYIFNLPSDVSITVTIAGLQCIFSLNNG